MLRNFCSPKYLKSYFSKIKFIHFIICKNLKLIKILSIKSRNSGINLLYPLRVSWKNN